MIKGTSTTSGSQTSNKSASSNKAPTAYTTTPYAQGWVPIQRGQNAPGYHSTVATPYSHPQPSTYQDRSAATEVKSVLAEHEISSASEAEDLTALVALYHAAVKEQQELKTLLARASSSGMQSKPKKK